MKRPTGNWLSVISIVAAFVAGVSALFFFGAERPQERIALAVVFATAIHLALFTAIASQILRAIWFLPADPAKVSDLDTPGE